MSQNDWFRLHVRPTDPHNQRFEKHVLSGFPCTQRPYGHVEAPPKVRIPPRNTQHGPYAAWAWHSHHEL